MIRDFLTLFQQEVFTKAWGISISLWPVWAPFLAIYAAFHMWLSYSRRQWIKSKGSVLLEIKLPNELMKSPAAMEVFLHNLHQTGVGSLTDVYFKGRVRPWFSLELVSDEGRVHFYIWMHESFKKLVETQLYAQFPNVEVIEVSDYSLAYPYDPVKYKFGKMSHIVLTKADAYPIKTYIDYGLDKDPKEEYKNDPLVPVLEFLGSLKKGEHAWIQILLQGHIKEGLKYGRLILKPDWKGAAEKEVESIRKKASPSADVSEFAKFTILSKGQQDIVSAIERSISKFAFDSMIRVMYFAEAEAHNPINIGGLLGAFRQFSSNTLNGFKPSWVADYDYPWQDFNGLRRARNERKMLEAYKRRAIFNEPFKNFHDKPYILTTEEVATLFHFPSSMVAATPTLTRIPSKKAEAPANLPI